MEPRSLTTGGERQPEANVARGAWVSRIWLEGCDLIGLELVEEAWVIGPEKADVGNLEEDHGDTFETEAKGPTYFVGDV